MSITCGCITPHLTISRSIYKMVYKHIQTSYIHCYTPINQVIKQQKCMATATFHLFIYMRRILYFTLICFSSRFTISLNVSIFAVNETQNKTIPKSWNATLLLVNDCRDALYHRISLPLAASLYLCRHSWCVFYKSFSRQNGFAVNLCSRK